MIVSEPHLEGFIPFGSQCDVIRLINSHDYSKTTPEILLSGAIGSAKSILLAHVAIVHCLTHPGARIAIGRQSLPDLKKTLYAEILEHLANLDKSLYRTKTHTGEIRFANGSEIISFSWGDKRYNKFRSYRLSGLIIEELAENMDEFMAGFKVMKGRVRRVPSVKQNFIICATNPGEPTSCWYEYFIEGSKNPKYQNSRFVFYSKTRDNPYLDPVYYDDLLRDYSVLEAQRELEGEWISLEGKGIYHAYAEGRNFLRQSYVPDLRYPVHITFDFNIAEGKPQSAALFQFIKGQWHFYAESVIKDANWCLDNLTDFEARGCFEGVFKIIVHGDAAGRARSSNSLRSNYDLIEAWLSDRRIPHSIDVPRSNPALVERWTTVNAMCQNAKLETRLFVYKDCPTLNQGMKLARKKPGTAIEDDSLPSQHITTALGYAVCYLRHDIEPKRKSATQRY